MGLFPIFFGDIAAMGSLLLTTYLLVLSVRCGGDVERMLLLGPSRRRSNAR